jgi:hypothetical protein
MTKYAPGFALNDRNSNNPRLWIAQCLVMSFCLCFAFIFLEKPYNFNLRNAYKLWTARHFIQNARWKLAPMEEVQAKWLVEIDSVRRICDWTILLTVRHCTSTLLLFMVLSKWHIYLKYLFHVFIIYNIRLCLDIFWNHTQFTIGLASALTPKVRCVFVWYIHELLAFSFGNPSPSIRPSNPGADPAFLKRGCVFWW